MGAIASLITSLTIVYSTVYSDADQTKHQSSASLGTGEFPTQMASNAEMFPFDDVIMSMIKIKSIFNFLHIKHIPSFLSLFLLAKIWQVCSFDRLLLAKIWQVCSFDRLLLAKIFNFGKYVRLTVCYLPKFSILTSMFVWRFVCLSVCLFVCLSVIFTILVASFKQSTPNFAHIWNLNLAIGV